MKRIEQQKAVGWIMFILNKKQTIVIHTKTTTTLTSCNNCKTEARTRKGYALKTRLRRTSMRTNPPP
eukprot:5997051-Heterocapsa_arctica.AAC.1